MQRLLSRLPWGAATARERLTPTARLAFEASFDRLARRLEDRRERGQDSRRHSRKYYAAQRLL